MATSGAQLWLRASTVNGRWNAHRYWTQKLRRARFLPVVVQLMSLFFSLFFFFCTIMCIYWAEGKPATVKTARRREMWHQARLALTDRNSPVTHLLTNALIHTQRTQNRRKILQSQSRRMTSKLEKLGDAFPGTCAQKLFACVSVLSTQFHH